MAKRTKYAVTKRLFTIVEVDDDEPPLFVSRDEELAWLERIEDRIEEAVKDATWEDDGLSFDPIKETA